MCYERRTTRGHQSLHREQGVVRGAGALGMNKKQLQAWVKTFKPAKPDCFLIGSDGRGHAVNSVGVWVSSMDSTHDTSGSWNFETVAALAKNSPSDFVDFALADPLDYDLSPLYDWEEHSTIPAGALQFLLPAMTTDEGREHLHAIYPLGDTEAYASDGHRLHVARASLPYPIPASAAFAAATLGKLAVYRADEGTLLVGGGFMVLAPGHRHKGSTAEKVIPASGPLLRFRGLARALKKIPKEFDRVKLGYGNEELSIGGEHELYGEFERRIPCEGAGLAFRQIEITQVEELPTIVINRRYLIEAVTDDCSLSWTGETNAVRVDTATTLAVVMPVRP